MAGMLYSRGRAVGRRRAEQAACRSNGAAQAAGPGSRALGQKHPEACGPGRQEAGGRAAAHLEATSALLCSLRRVLQVILQVPHALQRAAQAKQAGERSTHPHTVLTHSMLTSSCTLPLALAWVASKPSTPCPCSSSGQGAWSSGQKGGAGMGWRAGMSEASAGMTVAPTARSAARPAPAEAHTAARGGGSVPASGWCPQNVAWRVARSAHSALWRPHLAPPAAVPPRPPRSPERRRPWLPWTAAAQISRPARPWHEACACWLGGRPAWGCPWACPWWRRRASCCSLDGRIMAQVQRELMQQEGGEP